MYVDLIVRNKYSKVDQVDFVTDSRVAREKQPAKMPRVEHMTEK